MLNMPIKKFLIVLPALLLSTLFYTESQCSVDPVAIQVNVTQDFVISLPENASTGYAWYWLVNDTASLQAVELVDKQQIPYKKEIPGSGSTAQWTFKALTPGAVSLFFVHKRIWEQNSDTDVRRFDVTINKTGKKISKKNLKGSGGKGAQQ